MQTAGEQCRSFEKIKEVLNFENNLLNLFSLDKSDDLEKDWLGQTLGKRLIDCFKSA